MKLETLAAAYVYSCVFQSAERHTYAYELFLPDVFDLQQLSSISLLLYMHKHLRPSLYDVKQVMVFHKVPHQSRGGQNNAKAPLRRSF